MWNYIDIFQILLDVVTIVISIKLIFQRKFRIEKKDIILFVYIFACCVLNMANITAVGQSINMFLINSFEIIPVNSILGFLFLLFASLLINSILFKENDDKSTFCSTMLAFSLYLMLRFLSVFCFLLFGISGYMMSIGSRIITLFVLLLLINSKFIEILHKLTQEKSFITKIISTNIVILFIVVLKFFSFDIMKMKLYLWILFAIFISIFFVDIILFLYEEHRLQEKKRIHMIEQYIPIVEELISQVRARQHEYNNCMMAIENAVNSANSLNQARKNINALTKGISIKPNDSELLACDSKVIAGMIYGKMKQAEKDRIDIKIELHGEFKKSLVPETEWIEVIGILLDNAIEASKKGSTIYLECRKKENKLELCVSNPFSAMSNPEFMNLFQKGVTTKKDSNLHGFGLYNILTLCERYNGKIITKNIEIENDNYVVFGVLLP